MRFPTHGAVSVEWEGGKIEPVEEVSKTRDLILRHWKQRCPSQTWRLSTSASVS